MKLARQILLKLGLLSAAMLFVLLVAEIALRLAGVAYPRTTHADPVLGMLHRPSIKYHQHEEGDAWVECNSACFRDVEWTVDKQPDEFRVAVLGDSYAAALQIPVDERFTEIVARALNEQPQMFEGKHVRVMNFGMSGFGTGQELLLLRDRVAQYKPDLVVLAFLTGNDFSDNCRALRSISYRPFFTLHDGELELDHTYEKWVATENRTSKRIVYGLADWSRLVQLGNRVFRVLQDKVAIARATPRDLSGPVEIGLDAPVYYEPRTPEWREAWSLTEKLLLTMDKEVRQLGAGFLVVTLSNSEQVNPDLKVREECLMELGVDALTYPDDRIEKFCQEHGIAELKLAPLLLAYAESHQTYLHGFPNTQLGRGHWNATGHQVAGELIAQKVLDERRRVLGLVRTDPGDKGKL
jgi:hypothetical protein